MVVVALSILNGILRFYKIIAGSVTIALDKESVLNKSKGNWPLSVNQSIKPLLVIFRLYVNGLLSFLLFISSFNMSKVIDRSYKLIVT